MVVFDILGIAVYHYKVVCDIIMILSNDTDTVTIPIPFDEIFTKK